jgi:hypothetical protein
MSELAWFLCELRGDLAYFAVKILILLIERKPLTAKFAEESQRTLRNPLLGTSSVIVPLFFKA